MAAEWWIIEGADGIQELVGEDPTPAEIEVPEAFDAEGAPVFDIVDRFPHAVLRAKLPEWIDLSERRWDFAAAAPVSRFTPAEAAVKVWERAKQYRDRERFFAAVPVINVVPGATILAECKGESRSKIASQAMLATWAKTSGAPYEITFTDGSTPNQAFTVNADQVIAIQAAITLNDGACHVASQGVRAAIAAALEAGASADEIFEIDITAGYPDGPVSPPLPPSEPES